MLPAVSSVMTVRCGPDSVELLQVTKFSGNVFTGELYSNIFGFVVVSGFSKSTGLFITFVDEGVVMDWRSVGGSVGG